MGRIIHFEIHVDEMERAKNFYEAVFDWRFEDYSDYAGIPYFGAITGDDQFPGINGALMQRKGPSPKEGQSVNSAICTLGVGNYDETEAKILANGGKIAVPKYALPGKAIFWILKTIFWDFINPIKKRNKKYRRRISLRDFVAFLWKESI